MDFQILDISNDDVDNEYIITLYGKTLDNKNIVCHVNGFKPFFYIKVPNSFNITYCKDTFLKNIYPNKCGYSGDSKYKQDIDLKQVRLREYKEFYGYHVNKNDTIQKFNYLKVVFNTYKGFSMFKRKTVDYYVKNKNTTDLKIKSWIDCNIQECDACMYESSIPPIIKFIHEFDIEPSGWVRIKHYGEIIETKFKCDIEEFGYEF